MLGIWMSSAIVVGATIGVGIFMLPRSLAPLGHAVPYAWLISAVGIIALGYAASRLITPEGGGMQAYVGSRLGEVAGFAVTWSTCVSFCVSDAAIAVASMSFLSFLLPGLAAPGMVPLGAIAILAGLVLVNLTGIRSAGGLAIVTVAIKLLPLLAVIAMGALLAASSKAAVAAEAPVSFGSLAAGASLTLFALMGFETILTPVGKIRDPQRTIPLAIIAGIAFTALLYFAATQSLATILGPSAIEQSASPFASALSIWWGPAASGLTTLALAISAFGCANGGVMGIGEMLYSMALRREVPAAFTKVNRRGAPVYALIIGNSLSIILILLNSSKGTVALFTFLGTLASDGMLVLYTLAAIAALTVSRHPLTRIAAVVGFAFVAFAFYGSGLEATLMVLLLVGAGLIVRAAMRKSRTNPAPAVVAVETPGSSA
jgi:APA family basic amino acid/polyamine antiporter